MLKLFLIRQWLLFFNSRNQEDISRNLQAIPLTSVLTCCKRSTPFFIFHAGSFPRPMQFKTRLTGKSHCASNFKMSKSITVFWSSWIGASFHCNSTLKKEKRRRQRITTCALNSERKLKGLTREKKSFFSDPKYD